MTTTPTQITENVVRSFDGCPDPRQRELLKELVRRLHGFAVDMGLTEREWAEAIGFLTATGQKCDGTRQEFILLSDVLGLSMVVDAVNHERGGAATENTVLGPFYVAGMPELPNGASIARPGDGEPAHISGRVLDPTGAPIAGAVVDVWQNADNGLYSVQDDQQALENLRGRFTADAEGRYRFWAVRPTDYAIPDDGPVGQLLAASGRHPWRPAHVHMIASAPGYDTVTTHVFDDQSKFLDSDAVFGVKESLIRTFHGHDPAEAPEGAPETARTARWWSLAFDFVLQPS
jgi:hydroxyquinol 1,2-dioxygenase